MPRWLPFGGDDRIPGENRDLRAGLAVGLALVLILGSSATAQPFVLECSRPAARLKSNLPPAIDAIEIAATQSVEDVVVDLEITHSFIGDLDIDLSSPQQTSVRLHDQLGGDADDIDVTYHDEGFPAGSGPFDCGCVFQPSGPGVLADFGPEPAAGVWTLTVDDKIPGDSGSLDEWCLALFDGATPAPVGGLGCASAPGSGTALLSWSNTALYDEILVVVDGVPAATLAGTATSFETDPLTVPATVEAHVIGVVNGVQAAPSRCTVVLLPDVAINVCSQPGAPISTTLPPTIDVIGISADEPIADLQIELDITHTFQGDLVVDLFSPAGTNVRLHSKGGGPLDDLRLTFWELGVPNGSEPYDCACFMQPAGPGSLIDIIGAETTAGDWTLSVYDGLPLDNGVLNSWCVRTFDAGPTYPIGNLSCTSGFGSPVVDVTWTNPSVYDAIEVTVNGTVSTLPGTATSFSSPALPFPSTASVSVSGIVAGEATDPRTCELYLSLPPVNNLACTVTGTGAEVVAVWNNPGNYDEINVYVDGTLEATLPGTETTYTTLPYPGPLPSQVQIGVEGTLGPVQTQVVACEALLLPPADVEGCSAPYLEFPSMDMDTIEVVEDVVIGDTECWVDISHAFVGDIVLTLSSPSGAEVTLQDEAGRGDDDLFVIYSDVGVPHGASPFNCLCPMQPQGPGMMADFTGAFSAGAWVLTLTDVFPNADAGVLNEWCVRIFEQCPVQAPTGLTCQEVGGTVELTWSNPTPYDGVDIERDGVVIASLPGYSTSFADASAPPGSRRYRATGFNVGAACGSSSTFCQVTFGAIPFPSTNTPLVIPDGPGGLLTDTVEVTTPGAVTDVHCEVQITHTFQGDLLIDLESPTLTSIRLHNQGGGGGDDFDVLYTDYGIPNGDLPYDCGCEMQPSGPGQLGDLVGEEASGNWSLEVLDDLSSDTGTLESWALVAFGPDVPLVPDDLFVRGDCDADSVFNGILDGLTALNFQFVPGTAEPPCLRACDTDGDGVFNGIIDGLAILNFQFVPSSPPPAGPFPGCGADPTSPLSCEAPPAGCN